MPFKKLLRNCTILGLLAGALAGSVLAAYVTNIHYGEGDRGHAADDVFYDVRILDSMYEGKPDQLLSGEEDILRVDILNLSKSQDDPSCAARENARRALTEAARYRLKYPINKLDTESGAEKKWDKMIDDILADVLVKEAPPQSPP